MDSIKSAGQDQHGVCATAFKRYGRVPNLHVRCMYNESYAGGPVREYLENERDRKRTYMCRDRRTLRVYRTKRFYERANAERERAERISPFAFPVQRRTVPIASVELDGWTGLGSALR